MNPKIRLTLLVVALINGGMMLIGLALYLARPVWSELGVSMNVTTIDRAGAINESALATFHPSFGFRLPGGGIDVRGAVATWLAAPALEAERQNAMLLTVVAGANCIMIGFLWWHTRPAVRPQRDNQMSRSKEIAV